MASPLAQLANPPDDEEEGQEPGSTDTVPAMLTPHEAVLNTGAAKIMGKPAINKLNARGRKAGRKGKGYQEGTSDVEDDNPPGAPDYERGPLSNPKPTPPVKGYQSGTSDVEGNQYDRETGALVAGASQVRAAAGDRSASNFGSGWTPLDSLRTPPPLPVTAPVSPGATSIAGGHGNTNRVGPVPGAPVSATPAVNPNPGAQNVLSGIPAAPGGDVNVTSARPAANLGFQGKTPISSDITEPNPPSGAEIAGGKVRSAIGSAASAVGNFFARRAQPSAQPQAGIGGERVDIPATGTNALESVGGFARGLTGQAGRAIASGVSNAQAARIQQPTAKNPIPVTDTTPDSHPDESENAITRFGRLPTGLFDNPNTRRKLGYKKTAFAGF